MNGNINIANFAKTVTSSALDKSGLTVTLANPASPYQLPHPNGGYAVIIGQESTTAGCQVQQAEIIKYSGYEDDGRTLIITERGVGDTNPVDWGIGSLVTQPFLGEHYQLILSDLCSLSQVSIAHSTDLLAFFADLQQQSNLLSELRKKDLAKSDEVRKISGISEKLAQVADNQAMLTYASWSQFAYVTELNRLNGQSGIMAARKYEYTGDHAFHQPTAIGYSPYNGHDHGNIKNLVGTAEFALMANGVMCRARHNDDGLYQTSKVGTDFDQRQLIEPPALPADIAAATTPAAKIELAKKYLQVLNGDLPSSAVGHYADAFQWVMTGIEVYPEVYQHGESLRDPFAGHRHQINVETLPELFRQEEFYNQGGHKNIRENSVGIAMAINDVDEQGNPVVVLWRYRFISAPVGSLAAYPIDDTLEYFNDPITGTRWNKSHDSILASRLARFRVKQQKGSESAEGHYSRPSLIDELIQKIAGLEGYGNDLTERYQYYGANDLLKEYGKTEPLKAGYYNRWYTMSGVDASNRRHAMRGFHDDKLWVALTNNPRIKQSKFGNYSYGFSYFLPLEMHIQSFFNGNFNPYGVKDLTEEYSSVEIRNLYAQGKGRTEDNPLEGYHNWFFYYQNPADLFSDDIPKDPADTTVNGGVWLRCADGKARKHFPSGYGYFLPTKTILGKNIRTRYPIYFSHHEGSEAYKYSKVVRDDICKMAALSVAHTTDSLKQEQRLAALEQSSQQ